MGAFHSILACGWDVTLNIMEEVPGAVFFH